MPLKLSVRVGETVTVGGPATLRVESKSGQVIGLVFEADRSVPIDIVRDTETGAPKPRGATLGLGIGSRGDAPAAGLGPRT